MKIFGKTLGEYVRFEGGVLIFIAVVGLLRFALYQAGIQQSGAPEAPPPAPPEKVLGLVKWISMSAALLLGTAYVGFRTHRSGFGGIKQLLPLTFLQSLLANGIAALGVYVAIRFQTDTIYSLPEFSGPGRPDGKTWSHVLGHLAILTPAVTLITWGLAALVMIATRGPQPPAAPGEREPAVEAPGDSPAPGVAAALPEPVAPEPPSEPPMTVQ
jgi:hypothetical protein